MGCSIQWLVFLSRTYHLEVGKPGACLNSRNVGLLLPKVPEMKLKHSPAKASMRRLLPTDCLPSKMNWGMGKSTIPSLSWTRAFTSPSTLSSSDLAPTDDMASHSPSLGSTGNSKTRLVKACCGDRQLQSVSVKHRSFSFILLERQTCRGTHSHPQPPNEENKINLAKICGTEPQKNLLQCHGAELNILLQSRSLSNSWSSSQETTGGSDACNNQSTHWM